MGNTVLLMVVQAGDQDIAPRFEACQIEFHTLASTLAPRDVSQGIQSPGVFSQGIRHGDIVEGFFTGIGHG